MQRYERITTWQNLFLQALVMADEQMAVVVVEVEAGALAVAPHLAVLALVFLGPGTVAHHLELAVPYLPEVILIDIALIHVAAHRGTAANGTVATDAGHFDTGAAVEEMVAHPLLVGAEEALAGVAHIDECVRV